MYEVHHYPSSNLNMDVEKRMRGQLTEANFGLTNKVPEHEHVHKLLNFLLKSLFSCIFMFKIPDLYFYEILDV